MLTFSFSTLYTPKGMWTDFRMQFFWVLIFAFVIKTDERILKYYLLNKIIKFFLENRLVVSLLLIVLIAWGIISSPFSWDTGFLPNDPVPVDAIPDIGENQQIVYTEWPGRSPQDIEDQISYPLTTALLGIPGVQTIRSNSIFGSIG